jgi:hypothetical protein
MLHIQYIGLLNADLARKGPVRMFLQGEDSSARYILDRLAPWVEEMLGRAQEMMLDVRYLPGVNLGLLPPEVRAAIYQCLVAGGYKVRHVHSTEAYVPIEEVFHT